MHSTYSIVGYSNAQYSIVGYSNAQYSIVGYSNAQYSIVGYSNAQYSIVGYSNDTLAGHLQSVCKQKVGLLQNQMLKLKNQYSLLTGMLLRVFLLK